MVSEPKQEETLNYLHVWSVIGAFSLVLGVGFVPFGHQSAAAICIAFGLAWFGITYLWRRALRKTPVIY